MSQVLTSGELAEALAAALAEQLPGPVEVHGLERLTGGASRETWAFDAVDANGDRHALILRRDFPERTEPDDGAVGELERSVELELHRVLHAAGAPVPRPLGPLSEEAGLRDCYVMERVEGESRPRAIARKPELAGVRSRLASDTGRALATIHSVDTSTVPGLPYSGPDEQLALVRRRGSALATPAQSQLQCGARRRTLVQHPSHERELLVRAAVRQPGDGRGVDRVDRRERAPRV